ncbi:peptide ABC transporter substrate-binding protein [Leuconostoc gelidum]|uniref:peptide ABC transporter substrate-binding protein n=1 Tax=Leuconostoc gelidum TaxID=1244 RepID=UPI00027E6C49|nr:peptide ABC transporter substrate-binding protein [Leuconostoc gelidum]AFS39664.1 oligopeptide ABC transporter substrate-binding protein [Leuconostoc gelidum JB7]
MDTWKKVAIGAAAVVVVVGGTRAAGLWGGSSSGNSKNLSFQLPTPIQTLDISKNTDTYSGAIIGNSGSNLMRVDSKGKAQLELAKSVKVSDDGLKYTVVLKNGLKWSDGSKLTAQDFVYSWQRIVDPKTASQYAYLASGVKNADKIAAGKADVDTLGVTAKGNTITFDLERPLPQFEYLLTFSNFMPQKQSFVTKEGKKYATTAATSLYSGPYKVEGWNGTNNSFKLIKNDNYWDAKNIKTKQIDVQVVQKPETAVQLYKQGKIDRVLISGTPELYKANKNDKNVSKAPEATTAYLQYNQTGKNKFLANAKIREALNLATNRKELTDQVTAGISTPATGLAPEGLAKTASGEDLAKFVAPGYKFDPKKAATLFQEGLKEVGESQATITVTSDADSPAAKSTLDYLQGSWEKALPGLKINQKFVPFKQRLQDAQTQNFEILLTAWGGDYPEGSTFYDLFKNNGSYNDGKFINDAYTDAVNKAETKDALDQSDRDMDYKNAEAALFKNSNYSPLMFRAHYALQNSDVKGVVTNTTGLIQDFKYAYRK